MREQIMGVLDRLVEMGILSFHYIRCGLRHGWILFVIARMHLARPEAGGRIDHSTRYWCQQDSVFARVFLVLGCYKTVKIFLKCELPHTP